MSVKAGDLLHVANQILVDRIQTAGPGQLNIPTEKIYELGNYNSVATIRDIPDLTFAMESLDVSAEIEAMLLGRDFATDAAGQAYVIANSLPMDIISEFKRGKTDAAPYDVRASVALPFLTLESLSYRFGLRDNATQALSLRGDSIFYADGSAYTQEEAGTNVANQAITFANAPIAYNGDPIAGTRYALGVSLSTGQRLTKGVDYTETATTVTILNAVPLTTTIRVVYQSAVVANYPQASHEVASATRPAAIRGKDIEVRIGGATVGDRWTSIQSVTVDYRVTLERDEEFGNSQVVSQDYDVPVVTGSVDLKPRDVAELLTKIRQVAGGPTGVIGPFTSAPLEMHIILRSPTDGSVLKTLFVPDARFTLPGYSARVQTKQTITFPFESDAGSLTVYKGAKP